MLSKPIPLHSRASAHLFGGEDIIEFEDFFEKSQEDAECSSESIENLLHFDSFHPDVFDAIENDTPENELPGIIEDHLNTIRCPSYGRPSPQPKGANGKPLVYSSIKGDELPPYSFKFELTQWSGQTGLENAFCVNVFVMHASSIVGQLDAFLIDREAGSRSSFSVLCRQNEYVKNVISSVCDDHGTVRYGNVDVRTACYHKTATRGGLLVLKSIVVNSLHRHDDVGIRCVYTLLQWLNTDAAAFTAIQRVSSTWSLALVAPFGQGRLSPSNVQDRMDVNYRVIQQLLRIGFRQTEQGSSVMYIIPARLQQLPGRSTESLPAASLDKCSFMSPWN